MRSRPRSNSHSVDISEKAGVRFLHLGTDYIQGAMRIARPWALELSYTREMMASLLLRAGGNWPRRALLVGLGAGSLAKFIYRNLPDCRITVVEINPQIEFVARQYFNLPDDPRRLRVVIGDGAEYMLQGGDSYDLILCDGFDPEGNAGVLDTPPFYQACRARLSETGILAVNILGRNRGAKASTERITEAFSGRAVAFPPCDSGNVIAFAAAGDPVDLSMDEMRERALALRETSGLDLLSTIARLEQDESRPAGRLAI
ncbi:MAG: fused MFS/spermidine synthase [Actinomycetota bacterium]